MVFSYINCLVTNDNYASRTPKQLLLLIVNIMSLVPNKYVRESPGMDGIQYLLQIANC